MNRIVHCSGFVNPLTKKRDFATDHDNIRGVTPMDWPLVKRCMGCQKRYHWFKLQVWLKVHGLYYVKEYNGPIYKEGRKCKDQEDAQGHYDRITEFMRKKGARNHG